MPETEAAPGEGPPLHFHESQDEWLYVLDGALAEGAGMFVVGPPLAQSHPLP